MDRSPADAHPDRTTPVDIAARLEAEAAWLASRHQAAADQVTMELAGRLAALFPPSESSRAALLEVLARGQERDWPGDLIRVLAALAHVRGASWAQIGRACGTSRQAAHERFGPWEHQLAMAFDPHHPTTAHQGPPMPTTEVPAGQIRVVVHPDFHLRSELTAALQAVYGPGEVAYHDVLAQLPDRARVITTTRDEGVDIPTLLRTLPDPDKSSQEAGGNR
jgi:hypothetical protein